MRFRVPVTVPDSPSSVIIPNHNNNEQPSADGEALAPEEIVIFPAKEYAFVTRVEKGAVLVGDNEPCDYVHVVAPYKDPKTGELSHAQIDVSIHHVQYDSTPTRPQIDDMVTFAWPTILFDKEIKAPLKVEVGQVAFVSDVLRKPDSDTTDGLYGVMVPLPDGRVIHVKEVRGYLLRYESTPIPPKDGEMVALRCHHEAPLNLIPGDIGMVLSTHSDRSRRQRTYTLIVPTKDGQSIIATLPAYQLLSVNSIETAGKHFPEKALSKLMKFTQIQSERLRWLGDEAKKTTGDDLKSLMIKHSRSIRGGQHTTGTFRVRKAQCSQCDA